MSRPLGATLLRVAVLVLAGGLLAAAANAVSPAGIAWTEPAVSPLERRAEAAGIELVGLAEAQRIAAEGAVVVLDARRESVYAEGHIPGALSMPVGQAEAVFEQLQLLLPPEQPVLVYCGGRGCDDSLALGEFLTQQGLEDVRLFEGGMNAWRGAGLDEEQGL